MSHFTESPQVICHLQKMCSHDLRSTSAKSQRDSNNPVCMYVCISLLSLFMKFKPLETFSYYYTAYLRLTTISD